MDPNRIIQALKGTIDPNLRIAAENELNQVGELKLFVFQRRGGSETVLAQEWCRYLSCRADCVLVIVLGFGLVNLKIRCGEFKSGPKSAVQPNSSPSTTRAAASKNNRRLIWQPSRADGQLHWYPNFAMSTFGVDGPSAELCRCRTRRWAAPKSCN